MNISAGAGMVWGYSTQPDGEAEFYPGDEVYLDCDCEFYPVQKYVVSYEGTIIREIDYTVTEWSHWSGFAEGLSGDGDENGLVVTVTQEDIDSHLQENGDPAPWFNQYLILDYLTDKDVPKGGSFKLYVDMESDGEGQIHGSLGSWSYNLGFDFAFKKGRNTYVIDIVDSYGEIAMNDDGGAIHVQFFSGDFVGEYHIYKIALCNVGGAAEEQPEDQQSEPQQSEFDLTDDDFFEWTAADASGEKIRWYYCIYELEEPTSDVYGNSGLPKEIYADLSEYNRLEITLIDDSDEYDGVYPSPRPLLNRDIDEGQAPDHLVDCGNNAYQREAYMSVMRDNGDGTITYVVDIAKIVADYGYAHLHSIKGAYWRLITVTSMKLYK